MTLLRFKKRKSE